MKQNQPPSHAVQQADGGSADDPASVERRSRRSFLAQSSGAAVGFSLLPLTACVDRGLTSSKTDDKRRPLLAELEKEIATALKETKVPGLSIAIVQDGKLFWSGAFGVKDAASREPVDS